MKIKFCNEQVNDPYPQVCGKPASNKIQQYGYAFYVCDDHKGLYPLKPTNVLDPESLAEYRLCAIKKHKETFPHLYIHKPIEEYAKNYFAFRQAWFAIELKKWKDYSVPDLWDIFKVFDLSDKQFKELAKVVWHEVDKMDNAEWHEKRSKPEKEKQPIISRAPIEGYVYLLSADNGLHKIGKAKNLDDRVTHLAVKLPVKITLVHSIASNDYSWAEKHLHRMFSVKREHGEWFALDNNDVEKVKSIQRLDIPATHPTQREPDLKLLVGKI